MKALPLAFILASLVALAVLVITLAAKRSEQIAHPQDLFEENIVSPCPSSCRAFDAKITNYQDGKTIWIAFDCNSEDWHSLCKRFDIRMRQTYYLKFVTGRTPNDTGFEGYIDNDYRQLMDDEGRIFYERAIANQHYRIVYFERQL